jgi:hypothetical protein
VLDIIFALLGNAEGELDTQAFIDILNRRDSMYNRDQVPAFAYPQKLGAACDDTVRYQTMSSASIMISLVPFIYSNPSQN